MNPKKAEREPWEMFFIGLLYASVSLLFVDWIFLRDTVLSNYTSMLIITFTVMFSIPFMYFIIRYEEKKDLRISDERTLMKEHGKALNALIFLCMGFIVAFSFWYIVMPPDITAQNFRAQIQQYCVINMPESFESCLKQQGISITGNLIKMPHTGETSNSLTNFLSIFTNNLYVMIFILIFSLAFGAGAIFILAWNASVIAAAVGIFTQATLRNMHIGLMRYLIHGIPELAAYFVVALAGGILSVAIIRHELNSKKFWCILQDSVDLIILSVAILIFAALIEVFITPSLF